MKHVRAFVAHVGRLDEACRRVHARDLIHLHAVEVRMPHHQLRLQRLAGRERAEHAHLHLPEIA
jgi:hypothetical protein